VRAEVGDPMSVGASRRLVIDAVPRLDVFMLHRSGALTHGFVSQWVWSLPTLPIVVTARVEGHRLFLKLNDGPEVEYGIIQRLGTVGGSYPFLGCTCEQSVRYLYIHENRIACRQCHNLGFPAHQPGQWTRAGFRRIERVRAKLAALELDVLHNGSRRRQRPRSFRGATP
jgi:hypothetical protein